MVAFTIAAPAAVFAAPVQCECIRALREIRGINIRGNANTIPVTNPLNEATEGDVLLFDVGRLDHGAEIIGFKGEVHNGTHIAPEFIIVWEANWKRCQTGIRLVRFDDPKLKGVYRSYTQHVI